MATPLADSRLRRLLVIDQEAHAIAWVCGACEPDVEVRTVASLVMGVELAASFRPDAIVIAASMLDGEPTSDGSAHMFVERSIASLRSTYRALPVLVRCEGNHKSTFVAIAAGGLEGVEIISIAMDEERLKTLFAMIERHRRRQRYPRMQASPPSESVERRLTLLGSCPAMLNVFRSIGIMSRVRNPVLITGEVGTGKRSVARCIHDASNESSEPFHLIDAAATEPHAMETFLFTTSEPGTAALNEKLAGTLVIAHTEFLTTRLQAMLVSIFHAGNVKVRVILTTANPALLWPDLRYLLQGDSISLPPLRSRGDDIDILISHFAEEKLGGTFDGGAVQRYANSSVMELIKLHSWPGNLSELRSVIASELSGGRQILEDTESLRGKLGFASTEAPSNDLRGPHSLAESHLVAMAAVRDPESVMTAEIRDDRDRLTPQLRSEDFWRSEVAGYASSLPPAPEMGMLLGEATEAVEAGLIAAVLENTRGNIAQSARLLGITRVSLRRKIQAFQLNVPGRSTHP